MKKKDFNIANAPSPVGAYPHSKKVGDFLFLSGIGSRKSSDNSIPENFEGECHSVFRNVKIVLEESGAGFSIYSGVYRSGESGNTGGIYVRIVLA